jgi:endonuclease YncB( thermonuclease family)
MVAKRLRLAGGTFGLTLITLLFLLTFAVLAENTFTVTRVSDGDTVTCQGYGITFEVRLAGIDAPEKGSRSYPGQPYAEQARKFLQRLILNKQVTIEQVGLDRYNRILGIIYISGKNINLEMVKQGYAEVYRGKHQQDIRPYRQAEKRAKVESLNIWSQKNYLSPKEWRKRKN